MSAPEDSAGSSDAPALRIWVPDDELRDDESGGEDRGTSVADRTHGLSPRMTLSAFFSAYVEPIGLVASGASPTTIGCYRESLAYWDAFTGDPPLAEIDEYTCAEFVAGLGKLPGMKSPIISPNTVRKHCRHVQRVIDLAGPPGRDRKQRLAKGLVERPPYIARPEEREKPPEDSFTLDEIAKWLGACEQATQPRLPGITPETWWRALILFTYNTGLRIGTVLALEWTMRQDKWLVVPAECLKGGKKGQRFWLNKAACDALDSIDGIRLTIFPWKLEVRSLHRHREQLLRVAGLPEHRRFGFHGLRKALATSMARKNRLAAQQQLGHAVLATTEKHYVHPDVTEDIMADAMKNVPQPAAPDPQMRLF